MTKMIYILLFLLFPFVLFAQTWTVIDSVLIDEEKNEYYKLSPTYFSIYNDKIALRNDFEKEIIIIDDINSRKGKILDTEYFSKYVPKDSLINELGFPIIQSVRYDREGNLWFITNNAVFKYSDNELIYYKEIWNKENNPLEVRFHGLLEGFFNISFDLYNRPWVLVYITDPIEGCSYFYLCNFENNRFSEFYKYSIIRQGNFDLHFDNRNRLWQIASYDTVMIHTFAYTKKIVLKDMFDFIPGSLSRFEVCNLNDNAYIFSRNFGLYVYTGTNWFLDERFIEIYKEHLPGIVLTSYTCLDSSGNLWITPKFLSTLYMRKPDGEIYAYQPTDPFTQNRDNFAIESNNKGQILFANQYYGLIIFTPPETSSVENDRYRRGLPDVWLRKAYPNPAFDRTRVEFFLYPGVSDEINIELYNVMGCHIRNLNEYFSYDAFSAEGVVDFPVSDLQTGIYLVTISAGKNKRVQKVMVVRH